MMGKYKRLMSNTAILGAGTFASKVLVLLLMPFYTGILSTAEFGTADLISQTANLLMPLAAVGICDGIFRFTLDAAADGESKKRILSTGMAILLAGSALLCGVIQLLRLFDLLSGYLLLITLYVIAANLHAAFANYIRALGKTTLFAVQGIVNTMLTVLLNVLFLLVFDMGSTGYVLSVVIADFTMAIVLFVAARLYRDLSWRLADKQTARDMLKFSVPYIPTTVLWLITSVSDRYVVAAYCGEATNGLYAAAYKLPTLLTLVSGVFVEAWHFSTVKDAGEEEKSSFFGTVYVNFMSVMFMGASVLVAGAKIFTRILLSDSYYASWQYVPMLTMAMVFSTLVSFLGSVYFLKKKSTLSMLTALAGAVINVVLNFVLIPSHGAMGAAVATFISYLAVYVTRAYDTAHYLSFPMRHLRVIVNGGVLLLQTAVMIQAVRHWRWIQLAILVFMLVFNGKGIFLTFWHLVRRVIGQKREKREEKE
ncbi:MAG: polysaccharide biosynthesis C-terminal domain-containing protein [Clostridia bacterium]|nr:polysaccharide biosynthesis C-terminal domain-containing protein [Clostridia bacterium]